MEVMHGSELVVALKTERENTEYINGLRIVGWIQTKLVSANHNR